ncbi:metal binding domain of Ada-domain-containing protein [Aspergillus heterothallicus]
MSPKATSPKLPPLPKPISPITSSTPASASNIRWQAVVTRDATATGFVYAVITTKIYCRPSCSARLARRANVEFYDSPAQAERAGFRACKRCKPESLKPAVNPQIALVQRACRTVREDISKGRKPTLGKIAGEAGLTPSHFHRVFKRVMGVTPGKYAEGVLSEGGSTNGSSGGVVGANSAGWMDGDGSVGDVREKEGPFNGVAGYGNQNISPPLFQPWDDTVCADLDAWLMGCGDWEDTVRPTGVEEDATLLWNDFDALIAAEAQFRSGEGSTCPLTGAVDELSTILQGLNDALTPSLLTDLTDVTLLAAASELLNPNTVPKILAAGTVIEQIIRPDVISRVQQLDLATLLGDFSTVPLITSVASLLPEINLPTETVQAVLQNVQPYISELLSSLTRPETIEGAFTKSTTLYSALNSAITTQNLQRVDNAIDITLNLFTREFANEISNLATSVSGLLDPEILKEVGGFLQSAEGVLTSQFFNNTASVLDSAVNYRPTHPITMGGDHIGTLAVG